MRKMWLLVAVFSLSLALHVGVAKMLIAGRTEERIDKGIDGMSEKLKLSSDQKKTVEAALHEKMEKMQALHEDFKTRKAAIDDETDTKITAVLNAEQKATYAQMKE